MASSLYRKLVNRLRGRRHRWSPEADREFHEVLFRAQDFNPFDFSYTGYITILRFADLVSPFLEGLKTALDLGCGPAEITCELARRRPEVAFLGIDHSPAAVERARRNAAALKLSNISFLAAEAECFVPEHPLDIVLMFDAFHHLRRPDALVATLKKHSPRFLLIEPRGDWKGSWRKDLDFDWLLLELENIRARIAYLTGEDRGRMSPPASPRKTSLINPKTDAGAVENRYMLADFRNFFRGFGLTIRGTVSGLDVAPVNPVLPAATREKFTKIAYDLFAGLDEALFERGLDLLAKHWVIFAERGRPGRERRIPDDTPAAWGIPETKGPYDVTYAAYDGPRRAPAGEKLRARIRIRNDSFRFLDSGDSKNPDLISYHWLDRKGKTVVWDGLRTPLPRPVSPGEDCLVEFCIQTPEKAGSYILAVDMVREGMTWFSEAGCPSLRILFRIK